MGIHDNMIYTRGRLDGAPAPYFWCDSQHKTIYLVDPNQTVHSNFSFKNIILVCAGSNSFFVL